MKLNNKGITLVEIVISVALISIVLIFLFNLLIQVNNENADNEIKSSYLVNQSTFIKQIEEDFIEYKLSSATIFDDIETTGTTDENKLVLPSLDGTPTIQKKGQIGNIKCLKFTYSDSEYTYAYLFIYKKTEPSPAEGELPYKTILSYYRGNYRQSVELEEFNWDDNYSVDNEIYDAKCDTINEFTSCTLPIIGPDSNDYSINLSYAS